MNKINTKVAKKAIFNSWNCIDDYNCKKPSIFYVPNLRMQYAKGQWKRWIFPLSDLWRSVSKTLCITNLSRR